MKSIPRLTLLLLSFVAAVESSLAASSPVAATPTPTPFPEVDQSVTWQNTIQHDGNDAVSSLTPPLAVKWRRDFGSLGITSISYPLIAQGLVIVTTTGSGGVGSDFTKSLLALNEHTGRKVWSVAITGTYGFANAAYDSGKVFIVNFDGLMQAFNAATGKLLWSVKLPGQYAFTSPPAAANGTVFVGGAGSGGTLYAVDEKTGNVLWTGSVENGDSSSPAITPTQVFVSYACPQAYAFDPVTGQLQWHFSGGCEGGGGATPVVHLGRVYVRESYSTPTNGLILNANTGHQVGDFNSTTPPVFSGNLGLYLQSGTLRGIDVSTGKVLWSFAGNGDLTSAPLIVNKTIYIGSNSGVLYALDFKGHQVWTTQVGAAIPGSNEGGGPTTGLGAGDGLLVVPTGSTLVAYTSPALSLNISTRADVLTGDSVLIGGFIVHGPAPKKVIIRALGPSLPLDGHLLNPTLELHKPDGTIVTNDDWKVDDATGQPQADEVQATNLAPTDDSESALVAVLDPGSYTAIVRGKDDTNGLGLVEVYDLDGLNGSALANISTRGAVGTGDNVMIGGFILGPATAANPEVAIRALGPSLGLPDALQDPQLEVRNSNGTTVASNNDWATDQSQAQVQAHHLDPKDPHESALIRTLPVGSYTVLVSGHDGGSGIGLVEVYNVGGE